MSAFDLQKESDVKEYLEKLGIEYRFGCYSEKKAEGKSTRAENYHFRLSSGCKSLI